MNIEQTNNKEHGIAMGINNQEIISLDESLMQKIVDMRIENFLSTSEQYLLSTRNKRVVNFS